MKSNENYLIYFSRSEKKRMTELRASSSIDKLCFAILCQNGGQFLVLWMAETTYQYWPLNKLNLTDKPYVARNVDSQTVSTKSSLFKYI